MKSLFRTITVALVAAIAAVGEKLHSAVFGYMSNQGMVLGLTTISDVYTGKFPVRIVPTGCEINEVAIPFDYPAANPTVADLLLLAKVPAGVQIVDWDIIPEDADSNGAPTLAASFGSMNAGLTDLATTYKAAMVGFGTAAVERNASSACWSESSASERVIGLKWTAVAATYVAGKKGVLVLRVRG